MNRAQATRIACFGGPAAAVPFDHRRNGVFIFLTEGSAQSISSPLPGWIQPTAVKRMFLGTRVRIGDDVQVPPTATGDPLRHRRRGRPPDPPRRPRPDHLGGDAPAASQRSRCDHRESEGCRSVSERCPDCQPFPGCTTHSPAPDQLLTTVPISETPSPLQHLTPHGVRRRMADPRTGPPVHLRRRDRAGPSAASTSTSRPARRSGSSGRAGTVPDPPPGGTASSLSGGGMRNGVFGRRLRRLSTCRGRRATIARSGHGQLRNRENRSLR